MKRDEGAKGGRKSTAAARAEGETAGRGKQVEERPAARKKQIEKTPDGRYVLIDGRRWRATDPNIPEERRQQLVDELMRARRDVGRAKRACDAEAEREARARVHQCKVALGERGAKWWEERKG
ncbi:MAG TPA: hypothetical protein VEY11_18235 [Pyrinomonadaceae bacterium]|nr:hypothetical protein [Pyrinomonadaceae bacterium]